jgi:radical SAM superfamily enzyme YgiQ (UPF0313 family)
VVVVGNTVAQSIPHILLDRTDTDVAVMGEGDETIVDLLDNLRDGRDLSSVLGIQYRRNGEIVSTPPRPVIADIDEIPFPDWDIFNMEVYVQSASGAIDEPLPPVPRDSLRAMPVNTARGCPFKCTFCYHVFRGERYRTRSPESIIKEMQYLNERYGINYFLFHDDLTFFSVRQTEAFADALLDSGLRVFWRGSCRSGLFTHDEHIKVAQKLRRAGCMSLFYSLESADPGILNWMNKKVGPDAFSRQVEILRKADLASNTSIVIGYPNETEETIKTTMDCCIANGLYPSAGYLLPQPGSPMYEYALRHGHIPDEEEYLLRIGDRQDLHLNMTQMSDEHLQATVKGELARCSNELGLQLSGGKLLKTGFYRQPKRESKQ